MERTIYTRYANDRADRFAIRTDIVQDEDGIRKVYKYAMKEAGEEHVRHIKTAWDELNRAYRSSTLVFGDCGYQEVYGIGDMEPSRRRMWFPFEDGISLQELVMQAVHGGNMETVRQLIQEYIRRIREDGGNEEFQVTDGFREIFGSYVPGESRECATVSDVNMLFSNLLVEKGCRDALRADWKVVDYEWTFEFPIPKSFLIYRALNHIFTQALRETDLTFSMLLDMAQISRREAMIFAGMEEQFLAYQGKGALQIRDMQHSFGTKAYSIDQIGMGAEMEEYLSHVVEQARWIRVRRIRCQLERQDHQDGSFICSGWAFAQTKDGRYLPVEIHVLDKSGEELPASVHRVYRQDVAAALKLKNVASPFWGFECAWDAKRGQEWTIRFSLGGCEQLVGRMQHEK